MINKLLLALTIGFFAMGHILQSEAFIEVEKLLGLIHSTPSSVVNEEEEAPKAMIEKIEALKACPDSHAVAKCAETENFVVNGDRCSSTAKFSQCTMKACPDMMSGEKKAEAMKIFNELFEKIPNCNQRGEDIARLVAAENLEVAKQEEANPKQGLVGRGQGLPSPQHQVQTTGEDSKKADLMDTTALTPSRNRAHRTGVGQANLAQLIVCACALLTTLVLS